MRPRPDPGERDPLSLFRANMVHTRQSRPDSGFDFQAKNLKNLVVQVVHSSLGSGAVQGSRRGASVASVCCVFNTFFLESVDPQIRQLIIFTSKKSKIKLTGLRVN